MFSYGLSEDVLDRYFKIVSSSTDSIFQQRESMKHKKHLWMDLTPFYLSINRPVFLKTLLNLGLVLIEFERIFFSKVHVSFHLFITCFSHINFVTIFTLLHSFYSGKLVILTRTFLYWFITYVFVFYFYFKIILTLSNNTTFFFLSCIVLHLKWNIYIGLVAEIFFFFSIAEKIDWGTIKPIVTVSLLLRSSGLR